MRIRQIPDHVGEIHGGVAIGYLNMPPTLQRREHHEQIDCPIPLVLIVMPRGLSWLCLDRNARFAGQLLRSLVHADHRILWIVRPLINLQHILHVGYERRVGIRRDDPLFLQVRLERVFLSVRPIVVSLARSTMFSSTTASSTNCNVHRLRPPAFAWGRLLGGGAQARAISFASEAPSNMRGLAEAGECLRTRTASKPSSTSCWRVRATVSVLVSRASAIRVSLHPSPASEASAFNRMRALVSSRAGCLPICVSASSRSRSSSLSLTMYLFTALCFAVTMHLRRCGAIDSEIHRKIKDERH